MKPIRILSIDEGAGLARRLNVRKRPLGITPLKGDLKSFRTCQFLYGDPLRRDFCGESIVRGSYCHEHYELCHTKGGSADFWKKDRHRRGKTGLY